MPGPTDSAEVICGGDGSDQIDAKGGDDDVRGGKGNDTIWGRNGNDVIRGGDGEDKLYGGQGDDQIRGGENRDRMRGEMNDDTFYARDGTPDVINGGAGSNRCAQCDVDEEQLVHMQAQG